MKILVLNCGSSTVKFQLIELADGGDDRKLARGLVERIGAGASRSFQITGASAEEGPLPAHSHEIAVANAIDWLSAQCGPDFADAVGHRVVHGGREFTNAALIDDRVIGILESLSELAPLHNPASLSGIKAARKIFGESMPMVAAFDTSFHHTLPQEAATYAIPGELSERLRIRRYGFHGLAHQFSTLRYSQLANKDPDEVRIITLHLGNGCSACAIRNGHSVDTSMGFTPLEGLVMGTRSGDLDPAVVSYLARSLGMDMDRIENLLNTRSGLLGLSGLSADMRELISAYGSDPRAKLAIDVFCYRARKYIGAYLAAMNGAEALIFSGGIAENSPMIRQLICRDMDWCGLELDQQANDRLVGRDGEIGLAGARLKAFVVHTDEESIIARETARLIGATKAVSSR